MTTATLNLSRMQKRIQSKVNTIEVPMVDWKKVCFAGFVMGLALLVFYVWQVNNLTSGSYKLSSYESQVNKLSDENKGLQISFAENSFMEGALVKIQGLNFQKATSVKYINISDNSVKTAFVNKSL